MLSNNNIIRSERSHLYVDLFKKYITYSLIDYEELPIVYRNVPSIPIGGKGFGVDFTPITFLSCWFVQSRKGLFFVKTHQRRFIPMIWLEISTMITAFV